MLLGNRHRARIVAEQVEIPKGFWARARLWAFRSRPPESQAILFHSAAAHTMFLRFPVDVAFFDEKWKALSVVRGLKPFRGLRPVPGAAFVLMMPAGGLGEETLREGDEIEWVPRTGERAPEKMREAQQEQSESGRESSGRSF